MLARSMPSPNSLSQEEVGALRRGDILLFGIRTIRAQTWIQLPTVLVRPLRDRFWVHAALYGGDGVVWEACSRGVVATLLANHTPLSTPVRVLRHRYASSESIDDAIAFCAARLGRPYALFSVLYLALMNLLPGTFRWLASNDVLDHYFRRDGRFTCTELIVEAFAATAHPISPGPGWRVIVADLLDSPVLCDPLQRKPAEPEQVVQPTHLPRAVKPVPLRRMAGWRDPQESQHL